MIYTVFSTSNNPYMHWQSELLEYSWKQVGQPGLLIRLLAANDDDLLPSHLYAKTVVTQPWEIHPFTNDDFPPYNKPASLLEWLYRDEPDGTVLLLDPDCVFRSPIEREVSEGRPVSQTWIDFRSHDANTPFGLGSQFAFLSRYCVSTEPQVQGVMIPTMIHTQDLKRIAPRWLELTSLIRQEARDVHDRPLWESDMFAYIVAAAEYGLVHEYADLGICTNWQPRQVRHAPIIHYCQKIEAQNGETLWDKHHYQPWEKVTTALEPKHDYGRDLLILLHNFIASRDTPIIAPTVRPRRRRDIFEGRVRDEMMLLSSQSKQALSLNPTARAIWELCDGHRTVEEIVQELQQRYDGSEGHLSSDLSSALLRLREVGVLELDDVEVSG